MSNHNNSKNWFDDGGSSYAQFRPTYPSSLAKYLADSCQTHEKAVDVGCGNGYLIENSSVTPILI